MTAQRMTARRDGAGPGIAIRSERGCDAEAIRAVTEAAFEGAVHADGSEPGIPAALRADGALAISLVAERAAKSGAGEGEIVGHVAFSPVELGGEGGWLGVGPLSVRPDLQRSGIGGSLMREGLERARAGGARGCVLIGDPGYYRRFGFAAREGLRYGTVPDAYVMALPFGAGEPTGTIRFHPAFGEH